MNKYRVEIRLTAPVVTRFPFPTRARGQCPCCPISCGFHVNRRDSGIHRFDAHPDITLIHLALQRAHAVGGVVGNKFRDDRAIIIHHRNRRPIDLIQGARDNAPRHCPCQRDRRRVRIAHRFDTTAVTMAIPTSTAKIFVFILTTIQSKKADRVKHDCNLLRGSTSA